MNLRILQTRHPSRKALCLALVALIGWHVTHVRAARRGPPTLPLSWPRPRIHASSPPCPHTASLCAPASPWPPRTNPARSTAQRSADPSEMQRLYERVTDAFGEQAAWELFCDELGYMPEEDEPMGYEATSLI